MSGLPVSRGSTVPVIATVSLRVRLIDSDSAEMTGRGVLSPDQRMWHALVRRFGGFACEVRSVDDAKAALVRCRMGLDS